MKIEYCEGVADQDWSAMAGWNMRATLKTAEGSRVQEIEFVAAESRDGKPGFVFKGFSAGFEASASGAPFFVNEDDVEKLYIY